MKSALDIIREVGARVLAGPEGCACGHFEIVGIHVDASCHRSSAGLGDDNFYGNSLRVWAQAGESDPAYLLDIAKEVHRQNDEIGYGGKWAVRFCSYAHDKARSCVYCGKVDRAKPENYLCRACSKSGKDIDCYRALNDLPRYIGSDDDDTSEPSP